MRIKKIILAILILAIVAIIPGYPEVVNVVERKASEVTILVDPGHGGDDSGAIAADNTEEKNLNLEISKAIEKEAVQKGCKVLLTREKDEGVLPEGCVKWSKTKDIHERKRIIDSSNCDVALLIHLNSYKADTGVRGAQVFYPGSGDEQACENSEQLAKEIQKTLKNGLSDGSDRIAMMKKDVYLLKNISIPTVLVECGFLSNNFDLENLKNPKFQQKMAVYIIKSILNYNS